MDRLPFSKRSRSTDCEVAIALEVGPVTISQRPGLVGVIDRVYPLSDFVALKKMGVSIIEFRLDLFDTLALSDAIDYLKSLYDLQQFGILGTVRETRLNAMIRYGLFEAMMPYVDMVDIEVDSPIGLSLVSLAKSCGKLVLISDHNYLNTPSGDDLETVYSHALAFGPDIVKLAYQAESRDDMVRLMTFAHNKTADVSRPLVCVISMGEVGCVSRIMAGVFGSCLTYGYLGDTGVAPGQSSVTELATGVHALYTL